MSNIYYIFLRAFEDRILTTKKFDFVKNCTYVKIPIYSNKLLRNESGKKLLFNKYLLL